LTTSIVPLVASLALLVSFTLDPKTFLVTVMASVQREEKATKGGVNKNIKRQTTTAIYWHILHGHVSISPEWFQPTVYVTIDTSRAEE
jgi:hypothetical protein